MNAQGKMPFFFFSLIIIMAACSTGARAGCCCPTYWTAFGQNCYRFFAYNKTWEDAENYCQSYSVPSLGSGGTVIDSLGHLVSIHSQEEQNFISTVFTTSRKKETAPTAMWLGLHDISTEGEFEWTDGTPMDFTKWSPGQPDDYRTREDCGQMRSDYGNNLWNDVGCQSGSIPFFICKLPAN
ncbi:echinoidin-like [Lytechinus variegatus]|uniref:echinoidin-like n=1 Tax=Lytechinus variegatus TaxID=7654 RepID=UPI001BB0E1A7|nr:echinoidin-like [Lytechinus variegatus]